METIQLTLLMTFVAAASGLIGSFALHKRMSLVADAFSHVALPGIGIAFLIKTNPLYGGIAALLIGACVVWLLEEKSRLPTENIVGIIFIFSLALGAILTPEEDILGALFGGAQQIGPIEFIISVMLSIAAILLMLKIKDRITLISLSEEISQSLKIKRRFYNFLFLIVFSITVILGLKFLGVLLMGALVIIPAAIAKVFSWDQTSDMLFAQMFAVISADAGLLVSVIYSLPLGPTIALVCFAIFIASLLFRQLRKN